jgi:hypothetical protein
MSNQDHHHDNPDYTARHRWPRAGGAAAMSGRPPLYTAELAERVLDGIRDGRSLAELCADDAMPSENTLRAWVADDVDGFAARYRHARRIGRTVLPGQVRYSREIADEVTDALMTGRPLSEICKDVGMPSNNTVSCWVAEDRDGFAGRYRLARQIAHGRTGHIPYSKEIEEIILGELRSGRTLTDICRDPDMPHIRSVQNWLAADRDGFRARYREAREDGCDIVVDEMVDIGDGRGDDWIVQTRGDGTAEVMLDPHRSSKARLRFDIRRWRVSKIAPRRYGDRAEPDGKTDSGGWADLLKAVDARSRRGLPNENDE